MTGLLQGIPECSGELQLFPTRGTAAVDITYSFGRAGWFCFAWLGAESRSGIQIKRNSVIRPNATSHPSLAELIGDQTDTSPVVPGLHRMAKSADIPPWGSSVGCYAGPNSSNAGKRDCQEMWQEAMKRCFMPAMRRSRAFKHLWSKPPGVECAKSPNFFDWPPQQLTSRRKALWRPVASVLVVSSLLYGCGPEPKAPEPTVNPHPHEFTKLKITVEPGSGVTGVKVESLWNIGNIGCAPHQSWPSGASITKQVNTPERVEQVGADEWIAMVVDDRFLPDKCHWHGGGYGIDFMHDHIVLSSTGTGMQEIKQAGVLKLTCETDTHIRLPPLCLMRNQEAFLRARYPVFNATVEIVQ